MQDLDQNNEAYEHVQEADSTKTPPDTTSEPADDPQTPSKENETNTPPFDSLSTLARLITGLAIEGSLELLSILQEAEKESQAQQAEAKKENKTLTTAEKMRFITLGFMTESLQQTRKIVDDMTRHGHELSEKWAPQLAPLHDNFLVRPAKKRYFALLEEGNKTLQRWLEIGQDEEQHGRALARSTSSKVIDRIVEHLEQSDSTKDLIREQADSYLQFLTENPDAVRALVNNEVDAYLSKLEGNPTQMESLIQKLADQYVEYIRDNPNLMNRLVEEQADQYLMHLQENPELMQAVIQDQSLSMAGEMIDEVRERTVTIDGLMERLVRKIVRREPRTTLTSPEVRRLADHAPNLTHSNHVQTEEELF